MGWYRRFTNLLRSNRISRDIEREIAFHMAERADDLMANGMSEAEARREARRRFGNAGVQKERTRDVDVMTWLESVGADVRYAVRALRASPGFAVVAILSLGLGIGANTAIFSLLDAVVLRSLPVERPEELVQVTMGGKDSFGVFTNPIWEQIRDRQTVFAGVFADGTTSFNLSSGGEVRRAVGNWVGGDYFRTLGVRPEIGRLLTRADDVRGCNPIAVLSYGFWQTEFGGSPSVIGKTISLDSKPHVIVGVVDRSFSGVNVGESIQVFTPLCLRPGLDARSNWYLRIIGRPKPGVTLAQVNAFMAALAPAVFESTVPQRWGVAEKADYRKTKLAVKPAANGISEIRGAYERPLTVLMGLVGLVLLIACANVANLLLARAAVRGREMAIRLAIGAARPRLVRQLLTESVLLAGIGAVVGVALAQWGNRLLIGLLSGGRYPIQLDLGVDHRVLTFTILVAVATGILFGLAPAWRATRIDPHAALKAGGRGVAEGHSRFTIGRALVIGQIALSLVLVIGAGLLLGSFRKLATLDPGFRKDGILIVSVDLGKAGYQEGALATVQHDLLVRFRALPGVQAAATSSITPVSGSAWNDNIQVDGFVKKSEMDNLAYFNEVSDDFFNAMGTPFIAGRDFDEHDQLSSQPVAIVNETTARKFFAGSSPIGKHYRLVMHDSVSAPIEVIGVVKDAKYRDLREDILPTIYIPKSQNPKPGAYAEYELRTNGPPSALASGVKRTVADVNRAIAIQLATFTQQLDASLTRDRLLAMLSGFFGVLALLLATVGLYGTLSYSVARRRNEIGIRIALGAARGRVVNLVLGEVARMVVIGVVIGAIVALASTRLVKALLYGLSASDPATIVGATVVLAAVALGAGALPAIRASRVDPIAALRDE